MIDQHRKSGGLAYKRAMSIFTLLDDFDGKGKLTTDIRNNFKAYLDAQVKADRAKPDFIYHRTDVDIRDDLSREKGKGGRVFRRAINALNVNIQKIRLAVEFESRTSNSQIILYRQLKNTLAEMMEYTDREWAGIGVAIPSRRPISENMIASMASPMSGRVNSSGDLVNALLSSSVVDTKLRSYSKNVNEEFLTIFAH